MTPLELAEIQKEMGLGDVEFTRELGLDAPVRLNEIRAGVKIISANLAATAEDLLDDYRFARLILEKKICPQFANLIESSEKPQQIALITQLDRGKSEYWSSTQPESRLSLYKQIDKLAKAHFALENVAVVSRVEFIQAPAPMAGEEEPQELSVLGVRVEAL